MKAFAEIADRLAGYTERVVVSFVDMYAKIRRNAKEYSIRETAEDDMIRLTGELAQIAADRHLRIESCAEQIELHKLGAYNTCLNGCKYCYANFSDEKVAENANLYRVDSPMLCGSIGPEDKVTDRPVRSLRDEQICLEEYMHRQ